MRARARGLRRWLRVALLAPLPLLTASECRLSLGSDRLPVRDVVVVPAAVTLPVGGRAAVEGIGIDRLGGRVEVSLEWTTDDPAVATVAPSHAKWTVIIAVGAGETVVVAEHRGSGARDTVRVTVTANGVP